MHGRTVPAAGLIVIPHCATRCVYWLCSPRGPLVRLKIQVAIAGGITTLHVVLILRTDRTRRGGPYLSQGLGIWHNSFSLPCRSYLLALFRRILDDVFISSVYAFAHTQHTSGADLRFRAQDTGRARDDGWDALQFWCSD